MKSSKEQKSTTGYLFRDFQGWHFALIFLDLAFA